MLTISINKDTIPKNIAPKLSVKFFGEGEVRPVRKWLLSLDANIRKEIGADIQAIQWRWPVSKPLVDGLGSGLYEVRTTFQGRAFRVFFCIEDNAMILLHGFEKEQQKTPKPDLELARKRQKEVVT